MPLPLTRERHYTRDSVTSTMRPATGPCPGLARSRCRSIPSLRIRLLSVLGRSPSNCAAPENAFDAPCRMLEDEGHVVALGVGERPHTAG